MQSSIFVVGAASLGAAAFDLFYTRDIKYKHDPVKTQEYTKMWHYWLMAMPGIVIGACAVDVALAVFA